MEHGVQDKYYTKWYNGKNGSRPLNDPFPSYMFGKWTTRRCYMQWTSNNKMYIAYVSIGYQGTYWADPYIYLFTNETINKELADKAENEKKLQQTNSYLEEIKALKGTKVPSIDAKYSDVAKWVTSEYFYNNSKQLKQIAKTKDGQEKMKAWVKELNKHVRGGTKLTDTSDSTKITETNILYTAREYLNDLISTNGDSKEVDDTSNKYNNIGEKIQKIFSAALKTISGGTDRSVITFDDVLSNVEDYKPDESDMDANSAGKIESATSKILTTISNIGIVVAVIMLAILGIKYMIGSVEEKAQYKEDMLPYVIGASILFGITGLVKILIAIGDKIS